MNPFTIQNHLGAPTFFKNGVPIFPMLFWQSEILERDAHAFFNAGVELFSFLRSHHSLNMWTVE